MKPRIATVCDLKEQDGASLARVCLSNRVRYGKVMPGGRKKKKAIVISWRLKRLSKHRSKEGGWLTIV